MNDTPVRSGDILAGKYRVDRVLGHGNMGVVFAATHEALGQRVALKFLLSGAGAGAELRERFLREARATGRLKSHHVARVSDVGTLESEGLYIVMELLEGSDLGALLDARGPLPFDEAVEYVLQACEAVGEAHAAGIVHRDLKPANLFLTEDVGGAPCIKVLDFGVSKLTSELTLTQDAQALGSPLYMSPEQMRSSRDVDERSDLWSLGVVLYQLVAGSTPFHADTIQELCARALFGQPTPLAEHRADAPPGFEAVIHRCLQRDRELRYRNVAELAAALAPYAPERARVYAQRVARVSGSGDVRSPVGLPPPKEEVSAAPQARPVASMTQSSAWSQSSGPLAAPPPSASQETTSRGRTPTAPLRIAILMVLAVLLGGAAWAASRFFRASPVVEKPLPPIVEPDSTTAPVTAALPTAEPAAPTSVSVLPEVSATVATASASPAPPRPLVKPFPGGAAKAPARDACNPPYVISGDGHRRMKPQCL